ncbi:hypothetical protein FAUST_11059 [Fusarium austroamericanum]|uniref:DNA (cytosine-5-)-methyltransferase n=1 Tax=Fusarium austroamericanum TaxID=282268 RepID=A0AAN5YZN7_FUSAU|nr:hypothetical protein FAUST_11059 [Fusarium austroamericanum]
MVVTHIDIEQREEMEEVIFLTERPTGFPERRRCLSSCTLDGVDTVDVLDAVQVVNAVEVVDYDEIIDLTADLTGLPLSRQGELHLEKIQILNTTVQKDSFIRVRKFLFGKYHVKFVLVKTVIRCLSTNTIKIRGIPFIKASEAYSKPHDMMPNEVCMIIYQDEAKHQEFVDINLSDILQLHHLKLEVCFVGQGSRKRQVEEAFIRIHSSEADTQSKVSDEVLRKRWRGKTDKGGSWIPSNVSNPIDLESDAEDNKNRLDGQRYTMFDSCSGAGGVSRGALMAGFKIQYAIDKAPEVWETYETNFPDTELFRMPLDEFIAEPNVGHRRVDILHFSPPCQFFSPAHTHASVHDDDNIAALFGCNELLQKLRPRVVTVEQTFGLTHDRHGDYFNGLLHDFTQWNYSFRWKVVKLCTWGAAQDRKRLIIVAAAPGERLPPFPKATHGDEPGLLPYNTIGKALRGIQIEDDLHDPDRVHHFNPPRAPYDPERLAGTITTRGGDLYYPDGSRKLTLREFASLQGFPRWHLFLGNITSIKRQIGNAFPPVTVRVLYKHIEQWLLKEDGMTPCDDRNIIAIEEDSEDESPLSPDMMEVDIDERSNHDDCVAEAMVIELT